MKNFSHESYVKVKVKHFYFRPMGPRGFWEVKGGFIHAMPFPSHATTIPFLKLPLKAMVGSWQGNGMGTAWYV
jgi:hypothetical protein